MNADTLWRADVQQRIFRELVEAFSRPGEVRDLTRWIDGASALRAVLATLMDGEVTLADPHRLIAAPDWPLLQVRPSAPEAARYVAADGRRAPDFHPALGSLESPEFGATVLIAVARLGEGSLIMNLEGPGVNGRRELRVEGLRADWLLRRADWVSDFPLGVDLLVCDAERIVALPRTTRIHMNGEAQ